MTTRQETYGSYLNVCNLHKKERSKLITTVMTNIEQSEPQNERTDQSVLNLRGNNYFLKERMTKISDDDAFVLYHTLKINSCVCFLDLRFNRISDEGAGWLAQLLGDNKTLKHLNLMCNGIEAEGGCQIAASLQKNKCLIYLNLNGNKIANKGGMGMAQMLQVNATLEHLDLGDTDLKIESLIALSTILNYNRTLKALNVNRPCPQYQFANWMDEITQHFAIMLKRNSGLRELHMQKYEMRDYGCQWLSEHLTHNNYLVSLDLSCNRITRDGAKYLCEFLKKDTQLKSLDLGHNRLEDDGAVLLADALSIQNTHLERLSIKYNNIGAQGLCAMVDSLKENKHLSRLYVWGNHLEEPVALAFADVIEKGVLAAENTDVRPYRVDNKAYLCEVSNGVDMYFYWQPSYGDKIGKEI